jgi:hypothetical protein
VEAVATRDEVAGDLVLAALVSKADARRSVDVVHGDILAFEVQRT